LQSDSRMTTRTSILQDKLKHWCAVSGTFGLGGAWVLEF